MQELKNLGVGTDIEDIGRFRRLDKNNDNIFLNKIFTEKELDYSFSKAKPYQHLAARYAGKEAIIKALSSIGKNGIDYKEIEILNDDNGIPKVNLNYDGSLKVCISLSHSNDRALAFALILRQNE
ncbi:holo-ACP synthase [Candidatus Woesearchaeota archaeon]|nr:holo-ACP synthase [Candidatus Woesearchaeota archaeon]